MPTKHKSHKKDLKHKSHKKLKQKAIAKIYEKIDSNELDTSLYTSSTNTNTNTKLNTNTNTNTNTNNDSHFNFELKKNYPVNNSYPFANLGYNLPKPTYSAQVIRRPDDNKYFHNYRYNYNVQVNKPTLTYDNYVTRLAQKNMSNKERAYYEKLNQKYYYYNGNYELANNNPPVLQLQANIEYPMYSGGPMVGETNGQIGYTPQPTQSAQSTQVPNPNGFGLNSGNVQIYGNSPAYTGVQAKTLPGQDLIANINAQKTKAANANINNPAYFNYGQYYY